MAITKLIAGPGAGLYISNGKTELTAYTALTAGDVVCVDLTSVDATTGLYDTTKVAAAATAWYDIALVALEDMASGALGKFGVMGTYEILCDSGVAAGDPLSVEAGEETLITRTVETSTNAYKIVGLATEAAGAADETITVVFDGLNGFGFSAIDEAV